MPQHMVEEDLRRGSLVRIELEAEPIQSFSFVMRAFYRREAPPGPAGRWFVSKLKQY